MFNKICIIGVGLIGGSLASALKSHHLAKTITAYDAQPDHLEQALSLGIIDQTTSSMKDALFGADLIIICAPLSAYESLAERIEPYLEDQTIITDVGSIKEYAIEQFRQALPFEKFTRFIPAHPIAGTEKSGPSSYVDDLFKGRNLIITPLSASDKQAALTVQTMWEKLGSHVEFMDYEKHDFIYATVSHSIQFLATCYAVACQKHLKTYDQCDDAFKAFIRLSGSNAAMWRDIFLFNAKKIDISLDLFARNAQMLRDNIADSSHHDELERALALSATRRTLMEEVDDASKTPIFTAHSYHHLGENDRVWIDLLPKLLACLIMQGIARSEYPYATGAGLRSLSHPILLQDATSAQTILSHKKPLLRGLDQFIKEFNAMRKMLQNEDGKALFTSIEKGNELYIRLVQPTP